MKIGDKVRFLSEVGGGIVRGFQGKDVALVEGEDGFEIPMLIKECVVIQTDDYNIPLSSVMAFGDTTNDNLMIKNAGWGVCLLNGSNDTKQISDDITELDVENDGFAHYVEKHILNN